MSESLCLTNNTSQLQPPAPTTHFFNGINNNAKRQNEYKPHDEGPWEA